MSYSEEHTDDVCDKCLAFVGRKHLRAVPFIYLDRNDKMHPDVAGRKDYKQYFVCQRCLQDGV